MVFQRKVQIRGINPYVKVLATKAPVSNRARANPCRFWFESTESHPIRTDEHDAPGDGAFYLYLNGRVRSEAGVCRRCCAS